MPCERLYGPDRRVTGFLCSKGRKGKPCEFCGRPSTLLCDGPGKPPRKTCDARMCGACAVGVRSLDVDFCPRCAEEQQPELGPCRCGNGTAVKCHGPIVAKDNLCLRHSRLFTYWLLRGGSDVYLAANLSRAAKRQAFRAYLDGITAEQLGEALNG